VSGRSKLVSVEFYRVETTYIVMHIIPDIQHDFGDLRSMDHTIMSLKEGYVEISDCCTLPNLSTGFSIVAYEDRSLATFVSAMQLSGSVC
jgi:hypothetical protein